MRVSGVRRSWLTPASISVRCSIWRRMRSRIWLKARPATSHLRGAVELEIADVAALAEIVGGLRPGA